MKLLRKYHVAKNIKEHVLNIDMSNVSHNYIHNVPHIGVYMTTMSIKTSLYLRSNILMI
jgi:hypothetical protein